MSFLEKIFGSYSSKEIKKIMPNNAKQNTPSLFCLKRAIRC